MAERPDSNKTKIARRMVEVFEFFARGNSRVAVMDIVRTYGRPQSSTSELLRSLEELGLLYKDPRLRSYAPTPRLAALGSAAQPETIRNGRLFGCMDRLANSSRLSVGLFGILGPHTQILRLVHGADAATDGIGCGDIARLSDSSVGLLLLSTLGLNQASRMLWRLNAEAEPDKRLNLAKFNEAVAIHGGAGYVTGESGFAPGTKITAVLMPEAMGERRLALGVIYSDDALVDPDALVATLQHGIKQSLSSEGERESPLLRSLASAN